MKQVIRIPEITPTVEEKPIELTHNLDNNEGWVGTSLKPNDQTVEKIVYLGFCKYDGDMFALYTSSNSIFIYKGHLNSGKY